MRLSLRLVGTVITVCVLLAACTTSASPPATPASSTATATFPAVTASPTMGVSIHGSVVDQQGTPLEDATVRIQATTNETVTNAEGRFILAGVEDGVPVTVSAWKEGYYCASAEKVNPPAADISLQLRALQTTDNPEYQWIPPVGEISCYSCKPGVTQVWLEADAHGKSAVNPRFLTMYNGTNVDGNPSPPTRYATSRDYGRFPLPPDTSRPYYGPGYKLDFPDTAGNCAACHDPAAALDGAYATDPNTVGGVNLFGIHCDYCHKVADVTLDPATGMPYPNMPGVLSQKVLRPFPDDPDRYQLFFGTFDDDNVPMEDTNLPLIKESAWCAPCHFGVFWDTVVYNSFGEWLNSPWSNPQTGKTCQQCHMPSPTILNGAALTNVAPGKGGVERDPGSIHAHTFPGASSRELLQNALTLTATAARQEGRVVVEVTILNDKTGHHVPTDSPLRQVILLVEASNLDGTALNLTEGATIPAYGGVGDPDQGYYAGLPGKIFARILKETWTEVSPTGAYWNPTREVSDNRLPAFGSDASSYAFNAPFNGEVTVRVRLLFRRAFKELMDQKGWDVADILMAEQVLNIP